ncbi:MAG: sulfotransferase family 2 domain-containing protein [Marivita sp.]|uniref:sulfotransferase family 2 domain-containing protein n=1 Tax=Marivita sp. TaxID=2003365 RepID=UPI003EF8AEC8
MSDQIIEAPQPGPKQTHLFDYTYIPSPLKRPPICQAMMVDKHKLMYLPIAKNACSSLKRTVAMLGGLTLENGEDIHHKLDSERTGLQFEDRPDHEIRKALAAPDWMRFLIIREPLDRLVSVYVEKFVFNRNKADQVQTIGPAFQAILGKDTLTPEDFDRGLTFREFVEYILSECPERLNGHWRPQSEYLGHIPFTHVYDVKRLDLLAEDLRTHIGADIELPRMNVSRDKTKGQVYHKWAPDARPADLPTPKQLSIESFLPEDLFAQLTEYYATDITFHRLVQKLDRARTG